MAEDITIGSQAIKQIQELKAQLVLADEALVNISKNAIIAGKNLSSVSSPKGLNINSADNAKLNTELDRQSKIIAELSEKIVILSSVRIKSASITAAEAVNQRILNQNALSEARATSNMVGQYQKLDLAHKKALKSAQDLGAQYGIASRQFKNAANEANVLDTKLKQIDSSLGKNNRNIGGYTKAYNSLGSAFAQLGVVGGVAGVVSLGLKAFDTAKNLQSLNLALKAVTQTQDEYENQTLFLSNISEKYGLQIENLTKQFTQFYVSAKGKLAGKDIQEVFENISKSGSVLGLSNDALNRSFVALNQMLSKGTVSSEELRRQLAEALPGSVQAMTRAVQILHPEIKNLTEKGLFEMIKQGKILSEEVLPETSRQLLILTGADKAQGVETITKTVNRLSNAWVRMIDSINNSDSSGFGLFVKKIVGGLTNIMDFTGLLFKNEAQLQKYFQNIGKSEGLNRYQEILANISSASKEQQEITKKELIEREKQAIKSNLAIIESEKKKRESFAGGTRSLFHLQTKEEEEALKRIGASSAILKSISEERFVFRKKASDQETELTKAELKDIEDLSKAKAEAAKKEKELELAKNEAILNDDTLYYSDRITALNKYNSTKLVISRLDYEEDLRQAKNNNDKKATALYEYQIRNLKLIEDYAKKRRDLEKLDLDGIDKPVDVTIFNNKKIDKDPFQYVIKSAKDAQKELEKTGLRIAATEESIIRMNAVTKDYLGSFSTEFLQNSGFASIATFFDGTFKDILKGAESGKEKFGAYFQFISESAQEAFNIVSSLTSENFENEKTRLQQQYDTALLYAGDNKEAQEKLAEDLERKKAEIANREAKAKKKQAIANISIDMAQAIIGAWVKPGFPAAIALTGVIGSLGLAQIAMVNSQEIPQYFTGGTHDGGMMLVNDGSGSNFRETIVTPDGKIIQPKDRNVLMNAPSGTEIFTHDQWQQQLGNMLAGNSISFNQNNSQNNSISKSDLREVMLESIGSQTVYKTSFDANGVAEYVERKGNVTKRNINRGNGRGIKF